MNIFPPADVFIDSSIVIKNCFDFHSGDLERLRHYCEIGIIRLLTSEIVVKEVEKNIKQDVNSYASELRNFINKRKPINELKLLDDNHRFLFEDFRKLGWSEYISVQWHKYLETTGCQILSFSSVAVEDIVSDYFNNTPPFESARIKKSEFPDAIIIKSLIDYSSDSFVTTYVFATDTGWTNAFPEEKITILGESKKRFIVVDNINTILKHIYNIETKEAQSAKNVLSDINTISSVISSITKNDVENMSVSVDLKNTSLIDINEDYDEIEEIDVIDVTPMFSSFEEVADNYVSTIFDLELNIKITFSQTDYENSIYDSEDKVYLFLKHRRVTQYHHCETSVRVELEKHDDKHYHVSNIKYPYKIEISDETYILEEEQEDDDFDEYDDTMNLYEPDDDSLSGNLYESDDNTLKGNLHESDDDSLIVCLNESDDTN